MLLNSILRRLHSDENGVALAVVVGLMAVGMLMTTLVAGSVVTAYGHSSETRSGVESQAAAEAGIAAARAGLIAGTCSARNGVYTSTVAPVYTATIWVPLTASTWTRSCPVGTVTQVRILSTGQSITTGVAGASAGNSTSIEAILSAVTTSTQITATGPAIYAYNSSGFGGGGKLVTSGGAAASVLVKNGDVDCTGGASGAASLVVNSGNLIIDAGCTIAGNTWSSGRTTLPGGPNVGGNVVANGVTISGGSQVGGNVYSTSDLSMSGGPRVNGYATAASLNLQGGTIGQSAWIYGASVLNWGGTISGNITTKTLSVPDYSNLVGGTKTVTSPSPPGVSPYTTPTTPTVPNWIDFGSSPADYTSSTWTGFAVYTMGSDCSYSKVLAAVAAFNNNAGVIDSRACSGGITLDGANKVNVTADLAFIGNQFSFTGGAGFTSSGGTHRLWLINPDVTNNQVPDCASGESLKTDGGFTYSSSLQVMMYSPCQVQITSSTTFTGQVFSGQASINGGSTLNYTAVGLPGFNLDTGAASSSPTTEAQRSLLSQRNVTASN